MLWPLCFHLPHSIPNANYTDLPIIFPEIWSNLVSVSKSDTLQFVSGSNVDEILECGILSAHFIHSETFKFMRR